MEVIIILEKMRKMAIKVFIVNHLFSDVIDMVVVDWQFNFYDYQHQVDDGAVLL